MGDSSRLPRAFENDVQDNGYRKRSFARLPSVDHKVSIVKDQKKTSAVKRIRGEAGLFVTIFQDGELTKFNSKTLVFRFSVIAMLKIVLT